eukprot:5371262-Prorocentrum_lima.AAC.1
MPPSTLTPAPKGAEEEVPGIETWECPKGQSPPTPLEDCSKELSPLEVPQDSPRGKVPESPQQPANARRGCW